MGFRYGHFQEIVSRFGNELFASRLNHKLQVGLVFGV